MASSEIETKTQSSDEMLQDIQMKIINVTRTFQRCNKDCNKMKRKVKNAREKISSWRQEYSTAGKKIAEFEKLQTVDVNVNPEFIQMQESKQNLCMIINNEIKSTNILRTQLKSMLEAKVKLEERLKYLVNKRDNMGNRSNM